MSEEAKVEELVDQLGPRESAEETTNQQQEQNGFHAPHHEFERHLGKPDHGRQKKDGQRVSDEIFIKKQRDHIDQRTRKLDSRIQPMNERFGLIILS